MKSLIDKNEDGTIKITITIPLDVVNNTKSEVVSEMAKKANLAGFRPGKAPEKLIEDRLNPDQVRENILKKVLPQAYMTAVEEHAIKPIMNPKLHVEEIEDDKDWIVTATTCEMPAVDLGSYKSNVQKVTAKSKIVIPGKDLPAGRQENLKPAMDEIVKAVLESTTVTIPSVLVEQETDRLVAQLLDDIKKLGLSLDQYLTTTKRSPQDLRTEYGGRAESDIKLEFVLQKIAEAEKIAVDPKEIEEAILKAKSPEEKQSMEANKYLLAGILRQQKTLDFLMNL